MKKPNFKKPDFSMPKFNAAALGDLLNLPNKITLVRIAMIIPIVFFLLLPIPGKYVISAVLFVAAAASDGLDGHIARSRNLVTTLGKFLDPLADKLLILAVLVCLLRLGFIGGGTVAFILILTRELMVTGLRAIAADKNVIIAASYFGKFKTVSQIVALTYVLLACQFGWAMWLGTILVWIATAITVASGVDYFYKAKDLFFDEEAIAKAKAKAEAKAEAKAKAKYAFEEEYTDTEAEPEYNENNEDEE